MRISDDHVVQLVVDQLSFNKLVLLEESSNTEIVWPADWAKVAHWIDELASVNAGGVHYVLERPLPDPIPPNRPSIALTTEQLCRFAFACGYLYRTWVA